MNFDYKINKIKSPLSVQFELTYNCNNQCLFCYNVNKSPDAVSSDQDDLYNTILPYDKICKIIDKLVDAEVFELVFTGGEPTLHPDFLNILSYALDKGLKASFITNANSMTKELAKKIARLGVQAAQISLHGSTEQLHDSLTHTKNSFQKAMRGIDYLISQGIHLNLNMTVCKENKHDVFNTAKLAKEYGMKSFSMTRFIASGEGLANVDSIGLVKEDLESILDQIEKIDKELGIELSVLTPIPLCSISKPGLVLNRMSRCDGGISWCAISPAGKVRLCTNSNEIAGDLNTESLEDIWQNSSTFMRCQNLEQVPDECKTCAGFQFCGGGCRAQAFNCTGKYKGKDTSCTFENIENLNKNFNEILENIVGPDNKRNEYSQDISIMIQKPFVNRDFVYFRREKEGILAYDGFRSNMFNKDAMEIFDLCDSNRTLSEIITTLSRKFNQSAEELKPVITDFLIKSSQLNIVEWGQLNMDELKMKLDKPEVKKAR